MNNRNKNNITYSNIANNRNEYHNNKYKPTIIPQQAIESQTINLRKYYYEN